MRWSASRIMGHYKVSIYRGIVRFEDRIRAVASALPTGFGESWIGAHQAQSHRALVRLRRSGADLWVVELAAGLKALP
jgi:hypothetical protein